MTDIPTPASPGLTPPSLLAVDVAAVPNGEDQDQQHAVVNLVDDAVVAGAHTPLAPPSDELLRASGTRPAREQLNHRLNSEQCWAVQLAQLARGRASCAKTAEMYTSLVRMLPTAAVLSPL